MLPIVAVLAAVVLAELVFLAARVRRVAPGKILLVTRGGEAVRVIRAGRALLWPGERSVYASLAPSEVDFHVPEIASASGPVSVNCKASFALDLGDGVSLGSVRLLMEQPGRSLELAVGALEESLHRAFAAFPAGAIASDSAAVASKVRDAARSRLAALGFRLDTLEVSEVQGSPSLLDEGPTSAGDAAPLTTLVTTDNPHVLQLLGAHTFDRLHIAYLVARSGAEVLDLVRRHRPVAALVDSELVDGDGYEVSRTIKSEPRTNLTRVVMLIKSVVSQAELPRIKASRCDDLLCLPAPSFELHEHLACLVGVPFRKARRTSVALPVEVEALGRRFSGTLDDLSESGARMSLEGALPIEAKVVVRIPVATGLELRGKVVWASGGNSSYSAGVRFEEGSVGQVPKLRELCPWSIEEIDDGVLASLQGEVGVRSELPRLAEKLKGLPVALEVSGVTGISSEGQGLWGPFLASLSGSSLRIVGASVPFLRSVGASLPPSTIESVSLRYRCQQCGAEEVRVLQVAALLVEGGTRVAPTLVCPVCQGELGQADDDRAGLSVLAA